MRLAKTLWAAALIAFLPFASALAQDESQTQNRSGALLWLKDQALAKAFSGKTMDGIYKIPRERSGTSRFTESFHPDGTTDYAEGQITDKGQWKVEGGLICFHYDGALSGNISCFAVYKSGTCYYSFSPREIGESGLPRDSNRWSAKTIYRGDISTCDDLVS